ncbi:hypothetical protein SERLA73DRAFT_97029 [Serpula lacrymans var. lacrymans S7.3]|uniref:glutathione-specific gamma-glutamylcyclotransferase n=2 Tax=Serpula lacrymans var. lacrymans TaxID=341189 RepID=F8QC61_SERL3|nr:uncharacterized protein SERLADRAFT_358522 [Serpula lacrymans var. lacrymans S7.9]EGN94180.1 hypothetical protein SERLA73DRAFT_97029 [Serpula lacrymans var. lacrymans S7.3]EGO19605.1 hypothetical protein SERLADRAFT_358522 [Serpula lacrymans var. lacrymans S7.9]
MTTSPFVIFGYGSLIWKPPPHFASEVPGFIKGYVRRFAHRSRVHRGTFENPGRVVTLIHKEDWDNFSKLDPFPEDDVVWGVAFVIDPLFETEVRAELDYRERDGYNKQTVDIYSIENGVEKVVIPDAICYVSKRDNPSFVGSEPLDVIAQRILRSVGPSGRNKDYLYHLADSVRKLAPASYDSHLFALEARVRELDELEEI